MKKGLGTITLILALALTALPASHAAPVADYPVVNTNNAGDGSLRQVLLDANAAGGGNIVFAIPTSDPGYNAGTGVWTIQPLVALPSLTSGNITIDGYSQVGAAEATATTVATIVIEIDGTNVTGQNGFNIGSAGNTIKGLAINRFGWSGIAIGGASATNNTISGCYIGTDPDGTAGLGNTLDGVSILLGAHDNTIGGDNHAERNLISGNGGDGVGIYGDNTTGNTVSGNYIGTSAYGLTSRGNDRHGVHIYGGAHDNTIGGNDIAEKNVISGNYQNGVRIAGEDTRNNVVSRNYIGTDADGGWGWGNEGDGVVITGGARDNVIGGDRLPYARSNIISGNTGAGVVISGTHTMSNTVSGNYIGPIYGGTLSGGNLAGVKIIGGAQNNTIGGDTTGERNVISGNQESGIEISGDSTSGNVVLGNYIGTAPDGTGDMGNILHGVYIHDGAHGNTVGPDNIISRNDSHGVDVRDSAHDNTIGPHNIISYNFYGVYIRDQGVASVMSNTISGNSIYRNTDSGIRLYYAEHNIVSGNTVGIDELGNVGANGAEGVSLYQAHHNTIGPDNVISGNTEHGIRIEDSHDNIISGNYIGTNASGALALGFGNGQNGIRLGMDFVGPTGNTIGGTTAGAGNVIAGNGGHGVSVSAYGTGNPVIRNSIYANTGHGINVSVSWAPAAPIIVSTDLGSSIDIVGTACAGCTVEVFANSDDDGEGETFIGDAIADSSGTFTVTVSSLSKLYLTATATDAADNTSEFSDVFESTIQSVYLPLVLRD